MRQFVTCLAIAGCVNIATQHENNYRTGAAMFEGTLTPALFPTNSLRVTAMLPIDGKTLAQPLYVRNVRFAGDASATNGLFTVTSQDSVYAFDGRALRQKWRTPLAETGST